VQQNTIVEKVEMPPATLAALRGMMKEEIKHGVEETEKMVKKHVEEALQDIRKPSKISGSSERYQEKGVPYVP